MFDQMNRDMVWSELVKILTEQLGITASRIQPEATFAYDLSMG